MKILNVLALTLTLLAASACSHHMGGKKACKGKVEKCSTDKKACKDKKEKCKKEKKACCSKKKEVQKS